MLEGLALELYFETELKRRHPLTHSLAFAPFGLRPVVVEPPRADARRILARWLASRRLVRRGAIERALG